MVINYYTDRTEEGRPSQTEIYFLKNVELTHILFTLRGLEHHQQRILI